MTLEEDENTALYKSKKLASLKANINKIFAFMSPLILSVAWFMYHSSRDLDVPELWIGPIAVSLLLYLTLISIIHSGGSRTKWVIKDGLLIRKGEGSCKLSSKTVISTESISDLEGYYRLHASLLSIILKDSEFPKEEVIQAFKKEIPTAC